MNNDFSLKVNNVPVEGQVGTDEFTNYYSQIVLGNRDIEMGGDANYYTPLSHTGSLYAGFYYGKVEIRAPYTKRGLTIMATVIFKYDYNRQKGIIYKIDNVSSGEGYLLNFIGTQGDIVDINIMGYLQPVTTTSENQDLITGGNAVYNANERRTIIRSINGKVKITAGLNAEVFQVGEELEAGFVVQSAQNEVGVHSGYITFEIKVAASGWNIHYPNFYHTGTIHGSFYGTL
ncbi:hypothetical protein COR50_09530 [Chitinophaga caeni]|uniref:Uncharacterized protein n=1 Tax=Chitinophaga caeni TaxID=2029983 RepID=A0A291QTU8_9BACT|nr:hypothetical protein [Chitinophaga caeni]ATL47390.1 hypothetical protein COR50_09530 [Chitinophaga caeni]